MTATWKTVRVFISSTFRDMQAERDHLVRFVLPKLREELLKYRIHFVDVDLRWGVTGDEDASEVCREVIGECRPRFLCILGGRYGWVPAGRSRSITADEIDFGVLNPPAHDAGPVRAFFYFRKDEATAAIPEVNARSAGYREYPLPSEIKEHGLAEAEHRVAHRARELEKLKEDIKRHHLPLHLYDATWDAAQKRLTGLEVFGNQVHTDLLQSLKDDPELAARFTSDGTKALDEFTDEAEQMEVFIEERTERYITGSREPLLRDMLAFAAADNAPNIFVLTGDPGSGKSALLAKFTRDLATVHPKPFLIPHFIGASTGSTDLRRTLRRLCHELARAVGNTEPLPLDIKELITHFQKLLAEAASKQCVILVLDALNQFDATDGAHWLNWLPRELPPGVRIVASVIAPADGQSEHQTLAILRTRPGTRMEKLEPLTEADTLAVIDGCLRRYAKRLCPEQLAALLAKPAGQLPLYVLTALEELRTLGTYEEITDRIRALPGDARALFGWILTERLTRDPGFRDRKGRPCGAALVEKFAACLGVSRHGLSPAELTALLDPGDPLGNVAALLRLVRPYLMRRGELLDFYHGQFREAAEAAYLDTPEKQRATHQSVAACLQAFADPHRDGQCLDATPHALSELPHHQTRAGAWPELIATLENIFFLEVKVTHGMTFDLAEDFTAAVKALPPEHIEQQRLRLLNESLRRDLEFIHRHSWERAAYVRRSSDYHPVRSYCEVYPQALFQCLWNSAWWFDCPEAANHYVEPENGWKTQPPWRQPPERRLSTLLERWKEQKERNKPPLVWIRSLRPPFPPLGNGQLAVLRGHKGHVNKAIFSPDGSRIASCSTDKTLRIWDTPGGRELTVLHGHGWDINDMAYSPDGRWIVSGSSDNTVRVWDAVTGREVVVIRGHENWVRSVAVSPDGTRIASGSDDETVRVWNAATGTELAVLRGHEKSVQTVTFSPDGTRIISGSSDNTVRIWEAPSGRELAVLRGHESGVISVAYSPDGSRIVSSSEDKTLRVWDAPSGREIAVLRGHERWVRSATFSFDGCRIVSGSDDQTIRIWDAVSGCQLSLLRGHERWVCSVAFSPDGCLIVSGSLDKTVRLWHMGSNYELGALHDHENEVRCIAFAADGSRVLTGSRDHTVRVWAAATGHILDTLRGHMGYVNSVAFSFDGRRIVSGSGDSTVRVWETVNGSQLAVLPTDNSWLTGVAFSPDGARVVSGSSVGTVRVWEVSSGRQISIFHANDNPGDTTVAFSLDDTRIVSRSSHLRIWDAHTGDCLAILGKDTDLPFVVCGAVRSPLVVTDCLAEHVIEPPPADGGSPVAYLPLGLSHCTVHPNGREWAAALSQHLVLLRLEGWQEATLSSPLE